MKTYLIILVGFNPLPNFISVLSNIEEETKVFLVYTNTGENNLGTKSVAEKLEKLLNKRIDNLKINLVGIDKSNPKLINQCIDREILSKIINDNENSDKFRVILDYTGSTKMLASKFYSKLKEFEIKYSENSNIQVAYSYIDASKDEIMVKEGNMQKQFCREINLEVEEILAIHGFIIQSQSENKISLKYETGEIIEVVGLKMKGLFLECTFETKKNCISAVKLDLFRNRDYSIKLGGEQSITVLKTNLTEKEKTILKKDFNTTITNYVKDRVRIENL